MSKSNFNLSYFCNSLYLNEVLYFQHDLVLQHTFCDKYINKLGNLTLLKGEKNLAASTKGLSDKIEIYEKNSDSYFKITADICRDYKGKEWKKQDIDNRTGEFIKLLEKQLDVKLKTDKI